MATRGESTFDGIHTTSGYHLPWALLLAAVSSVVRIFTLDKAIHLGAYLAVAFSIALATSRHFFTSTLFRAAAFVVLVGSFSLTEMTIAAPIVLGLLRSSARPISSRLEPWLAFLLSIIRVDLVCVPLVAAGILVARERRRAITMLVATAAGLGMQLLVMKLAFGHFLGVAAWLKASAAIGSLAASMRFNLTGSAFQGGLFAAHALLAAMALGHRRDRAMWLLVCAPVSFLAMHTVLGVVRGWYFVPSTLALIFALEHAIETGRRAERLTSLARAAVALLALVVVTRAIRTEIVYAGDQRVAATFISELRGRLPAGTLVYVFDRSGFLGYFSGLSVVDGDGLVNDFEYARRLDEGRLAGYLEEQRICHVVAVDADVDPVRDVSGLVVRRVDVELLYVIRRKVESQADYALYRIAAERCASR